MTINKKIFRRERNILPSKSVLKVKPLERMIL